MIEKEQIQELIGLAFDAQERAYTPYSHFRVGAALLTTDGRIYQGCNIENAAYSPTNCAERTAFFKAVSEGDRDFSAIAIVGNKEEIPKGMGDLCAPCGVCRQVMMEFCDPSSFLVILAISEENYKVFTLEEVLPMGFGPGELLEETHRSNMSTKVDTCLV